MTMSETAYDACPPVPPKLIVSRPADEAANRPRHRKRHTSAASKEQGQSSSSDWSDVEDSPPRRQRTSKHHSHRHSRPTRSANGSQVSPRSEDSDLGRFFPRLSRILEANETTGSRPSTRGSDSRRPRSPGRVSRRRDDTSSVHRRSQKHRPSAVQRRHESLLKINPSLLSVLSTLTGVSDRSSGSNSTITQQSYDRRGSDSSKTPTGRPRRPDSGIGYMSSTTSKPGMPSVFDYMEGMDEDRRDSNSVVSSSSSSHYEPSLAGSSEAPDTPSSRSTFPSPTATRSQSVAELRRKYDPHCSGSVGSLRSNSQSPESSVRSLPRQPTVSDVIEEEDEGGAEPIAPSEVTYEHRQRSSSRSSRSSQRSTDRLRKQEESMRQHMAYGNQQQPHGQYPDAAYGQHRSSSISSAHSDQAAYHYQTAIQQYHWPSPHLIPHPHPPHPMSGHIDRPPAPDAPDLSQRTLSGYELLALELSNPSSSVKPMYRKFAYLNHRLLLHLQDELSEMEEQLRVLDEIIAQMDPALAEGQRTPASRRGECYAGTDIHHQRTGLLGRVFLKTEQYGRAMKAFKEMGEGVGMPEEGEVERDIGRWMGKFAPVHEVEARFLRFTEDLVVPGANSAQPALSEWPTRQAALAYLPVALMLPLLLFSIIPTLAGRLVVTALIAVGAFIVAATTRVRFWMPAREWAVCGACYVLLMAAVAGCIPSYG